MRHHRQTHPGFTLVEILITVGITGLLLGLIVARYNQGNSSSVLNREVARLTSAIRLAQQQTASGEEAPSFCSQDVTKTCNQSSDCGGSQTCTAAKPPEGGFAMLFSCAKPVVYPNDLLYVSPLAASSYFMYADRQACTATLPPPSYDCFPPQSGSYSGPWTPGLSDGVITSFLQSGKLQGDVLSATYTLDQKVDVRDLRLTVATTGTQYTCTSGSPWKGQAEPVHNENIAATYPLQGLIRFVPPTGRQVVLSDNVSTTAPSSGNAYQKLDVMLGVVNTTDCRIITITREGTVTTSVSSTCAFS